MGFTRFFILPCYLLLCLAASTTQAAGIAYTVNIPALPDNLGTLLLSVSDCENLKGTPPETEGLLRQRMRNDLSAFDQVLKARGYFKAHLGGTIDRSTTPHKIQFSIDPGSRFTFASPVLHFSPSGSPAETQTRETLSSIAAGKDYASDLVVAVESDMLRMLRENGYPSPAVSSRKVVADHATQTVEVEFRLDAGTPATFGPADIQGLDRVDPMLVTGKLAWHQGDAFDARKIDATRAALIKTGLFRSARIDPEISANGQEVIMHLQLKESPPRSVKAGLWYYSDQGPGVSFGWTHRNLFGQGQELNLDTSLSGNEQAATAGLTIPEFLHLRQSLELSSAYDHEKTDVYDSSKIIMSAMLRRTFSELLLGAGLTYRFIDIREEDLRTFNLVSTPLIAELSTADNLLDPSRGMHLALRLEPFANIENSGASFIYWDLVARHYLPLVGERKLILATRGRYSLLAGTSRNAIPEDLLLYAGGGGSIRGYAYQYAGELDQDDDPLGGVAAVDFSTELRWRINEEFGLVLFGDGGGSYGTRFPKDMSGLFWGVGAGIRYYTPIGPLRFDAAIPLDRRDGVDAPYQLYVSLGQAF